VDGSRFDAITRSLATGRSHRSVLGALVGAGLAGLGFGGHTDARRRRSLDNICAAGGDCCSGVCMTVGRARKVCACGASADCPTGDQCHAPLCAAGACSLQVTTGAPCDDQDRCTTRDACRADGVCAGAAVVCTPPKECFTAGACQAASGRCADAAYLGDGARCSTGVCFKEACCTSDSLAATCASGKCGPQTNNCGITVQCLTLAAGSCAQDADCCSGVCVTDGNGANGVCQAGPVAVGGACDSNGDCASHACCAGVCRDLSADPDHCGACTTVCSSNHMATRTCASGICTGACAAGYADCHATKQTDGCETSITANTNNCGGCEIHCSGTQFCSAGACLDKVAAGGSCTFDGGCQSRHCCGSVCVDIDADANNCGQCSLSCQFGQVCASAACACPDAKTLCSLGFGAFGCFDLTANLNSCGTCGHVCVIGQSCINGVCGCPGGQRFCINSDKVCVDAQTDPKNCGSCDNACPSGTTCVNGTCSCASGQTYCVHSNNVCTNTQTDAHNCGACDHACPAGNACANGACVCAATSCCPAGRTYCVNVGGEAGCVDTQVDPLNCGDCGFGGSIGGAGGICGLFDQSKSSCCAGVCVDGLHDPNNCGTCGNVCDSQFETGTCTFGHCVSKACPANFANCDGKVDNSCETNLLTDPNNCGGCGIVCPCQESDGSPGGQCLNGSCCVAKSGLCCVDSPCCNGNRCDGFSFFC